MAAGSRSLCFSFLFKRRSISLVPRLGRPSQGPRPGKASRGRRRHRAASLRSTSSSENQRLTPLQPHPSTPGAPRLLASLHLSGLLSLTRFLMVQRPRGALGPHRGFPGTPSVPPGPSVRASARAGTHPTARGAREARASSRHSAHSAWPTPLKWKTRRQAGVCRIACCVASVHC